MLHSVKIAATVAALGLATSADAALLDFTTATNDGTTVTAVGATAVASPGSSMIIGDFADNAICAIGGGGCNGVFTLTFDFDVMNVMFDYGFGNAGDIALLSVLDGLGGLIGGLTLNSEAGVASADLSSFGVFRSIVFDNSSALGAGYAYGNITYDPAMAPVPLPASMPLMLVGLAGVALLRRKRAA